MFRFDVQMLHYFHSKAVKFVCFRKHPLFDLATISVKVQKIKKRTGEIYIDRHLKFVYCNELLNIFLWILKSGAFLTPPPTKYAPFRFYKKRFRVLFEWVRARKNFVLSLQKDVARSYLCEIITTAFYQGII